MKVGKRMVPGIIVLMLAFFASAIAINPPKDGKFPKNFWETVLQDPSLIRYDTNAWALKMKQRHKIRMEMSLGKLANVELATDNFYVPVLLGQYTDLSGVFATSDFQNLLFDNNPDGTLTDYYNEISYGQFNVTGTVYGWFTADQNQAYYASNNNGLNSNYPQNGQGFVRSIVEKADPTVDFSQYDNDGPDGIPNSGDDDGYVDGVIVVYAGAGADWSPRNSNLWPFKSDLGSNEYTTNDASANGGTVKVSTFVVCPEKAGGGAGLNQVRPIGVFAHEFGHVLGLPDLYDRDGSSNGIGEWDLMASGSWGGDGAHSEKPAHMSAWAKIQMGWLTPTIVSTNTNGLSIPQAETNAAAFLIWEDGYQLSRYFLVENRQQTGFDFYLNGPGLLIFHVDENQHWGPNRSGFGTVNDDETHKLVDLEEADGLANLDNNINRGDAGDPYPGSSNNRAFTDTSNPNSRDYDGNPTGVEIKNISNSGPTMTADITVRNLLGYSLAYDEEGITGWGWGFPTPTDIWGGVLFTAAEAGTLAAVDAGFKTGPTNYQIDVYSTFFNLTPSGLLASTSGQVSSSGWYTIPIPGNSAVVSANQDFFVSIKIEDQAYGLSYDRYGPNSGRSYTSGNGITYSNQIGTDPNGGDLNLRVRIKSESITAIEPDEGITVKDYQLQQNFPNPFNGGTVIRYLLPAKQKVVLEVYNLLGQRMLTLLDREETAGEHEIQFRPENLPSGIYIYKLQAGDFKAVRKMIYLK